MHSWRRGRYSLEPLKHANPDRKNRCVSPRKFFQERLRGTQIRCLEPLGEAIIDFGEKPPSLDAATLGRAQAPEAECGA